MRFVAKGFIKIKNFVAFCGGRKTGEPEEKP